MNNQLLWISCKEIQPKLNIMLPNNPYTSEQALRNANYLKPEANNRIISLSHKKLASEESHIFRQVQALIGEADFPCLAAKASFNTQSCRMGIYKTLADAEVSRGLAHDLLRFGRESEQLESDFTSFIAVFKSPAPETEEAFEALLWKQLRQLHQLDVPHHNWDPTVASDPADKNFSFSFGGKAFFVVGMHPRSSRLARHAPYPILVFNPHAQFEALREKGKFEGLKKAIRQRDIALQGFVNPMLSDYGENSEARQYAGRAVGKNWKCPFH